MFRPKSPSDRLFALFACAHHHKIPLSTAAARLGLGKEELKDAVIYRLHVSDLGYEYDTDYQATLARCMAKLANSN